MPELPEVEVVRQSLDKKIIHKKVKKVIVRNRNLRLKVPLNFSSFLKNQKIVKVDRFSKYLILNFKSGDFCLIHLGMSGTIHIINNKKKLKFTNASFYHSPILPKKHNHIELIFNSLKVVYNDPRRFGFFELVENNKKLENRFKNLGPEPFNLNFNLNYVFNYFKGKNKNIKTFLLDQKFVSGIGNIYASEILYASKIDPLTQVQNLSKFQLKKIIENSKKILLKAIKQGGSTIRDFKNTKGETGQFQKNLNVYGRDKKNCKKLNCLGIISKITQSNRSTFLCKKCQK